MNKLHFSALFGALVLSGCATQPLSSSDIVKEQAKIEQAKAEYAQDKAEAKLASVPSWVLTPPQSDGTGVYGVGIGESRVLNNAMKKSSLNAQFELAKVYGQTLAGSEQSYVKDSGFGSKEQYTQLIDSLVKSVPMSGYETVEHEVTTIDGKYTSYRLMKLTYEQFNKAIELASEKETAIEVQKAFDELHKRLSEEYTTDSL